MESELEILINRYHNLCIDKQIDYDKFYLYSIITHSTAIEGSTITELENQVLFDQGISIGGKSVVEQMMNIDLKAAYEKSISLANAHTDLSISLLKELSAMVMKNTGKEYKTILGDFSSSNGDLRLLNVTAGVGGKSYLGYNKVPSRLQQFCDEINAARKTIREGEVKLLYELSFDAHYKLVTIHPWADGNGRMARLIMNYIQFEFGLIPSKILKDDKEDYIKALVDTREKDDITIFRRFMTKVMVKSLRNDIDIFLSSTSEISGEKKLKSREKILSLLSKKSTISASAIANEIGISSKAVEKHISKLKAEGILVRIGPDKGGHWEVRK